MKKPSFKVVTNVVVLLSLLGVGTEALRPHVPKKSTNNLEGSREFYLRQAAYQSIRWYPNSSTAYSRARNESKPILLVVGAPWSEVARRMDERIFKDADVARFLSHNFVCIRIDASEEREWLSALLPFSRMVLGIQPGFQAWVLDPKGHVVDYLGRSLHEDATPDQFLDGLSTSADLVDRIRSQDEEVLPENLAQQDDLAFLRRQSSIKEPNFDEFRIWLENKVDDRHGGFPSPGSQVLHPHAFHFLYQTDSNRFDSALERTIFSNFHDLTDGGFFRRRSLEGKGAIVAFDKIATLNAEMCWLLAMVGAEKRDASLRILSRNAFDCVTQSLAHDGLVATASVGSREPNRRSLRHSWGLGRLYRHLSNDDVAWAEDRLNLRPSTNRQMIPHFKDKMDLLAGWPRAQRIVRQLRPTLVQDPVATPNSAEAHCLSTARLLQAARLWQTPERLRTVLDLAIHARRFRFKEGVRARSDDLVDSHYLGDWLAYADLNLELYLTNGNQMALQEGSRILRSALLRFAGLVPGEYLTSNVVPKPLAAQDASAPEVADNVHESCLARTIRLCGSYGTLLGDTPEGRGLRHQAEKSIALYSESLREAGALAAGFHSAAYRYRHQPVLFSVGSNALELSRQVYQLLPSALCAPTGGFVRKDLQGKESGIYWMSNGGFEGPLTPAAAAKRARSDATAATDAP